MWQYRLVGGDGSPIQLTLYGVFAGTVVANTTYTFDGFPGDARQGRTTTGFATQSGNRFNISFTNGCGTIVVSGVKPASATAFAVGSTPDMADESPAARVSSGAQTTGTAPETGSGLLAYPNPTGDVLTVRLNQLLPANPVFVLMDMSGRTYEVGRT